MKVLSTPKKDIKKIRLWALSTSVPVPFQKVKVYFFSTTGRRTCYWFADRFYETAGRFSYCLDEQEMLQQLKVLIEARKWKSFFAGDQYAKMLVANGLETVLPRIERLRCFCYRL